MTSLQLVSCPTHGTEPLSVFVLCIRTEHRARQRYVRAQTALTNQARAFCRSLTGAALAAQGADTTHMTDAQLAKVKVQADALYRAAIQHLRGKSSGGFDIQSDSDELSEADAGGDEAVVGDDIQYTRASSPTRTKPLIDIAPLAPVAAQRIAPFIAAHAAQHQAVLAQNRIIETMAGCLPVAPWAQGIRGLGILSLGQIVGEGEDIDRFPTVNLFWKRMGLGVVDGQRQRRTTDKDLAIRMGYNAERRALMYVVADNLVKLNQTGAYRTYYLTEKERQRTLHPDLTPAHVNERAKRHMAKRLLRDLWREWTGRGVEWPAAVAV